MSSAGSGDHGLISISPRLAIIQAAVLVLLLLPATNRQTPYQTLSTNPNNHQTTVNTVTFNAVFNPNSPESAIRSLLLSVNGTLVSGPSPQGRYVIAVPLKNNMKDVVKTLTQTEVITFIEKTL